MEPKWFRVRADRRGAVDAHGDRSVTATITMHSSFEAYSVQIGEKPIRRGSSGARFALERDDFRAG